MNEKLQEGDGHEREDIFSIGRSLMEEVELVDVLRVVLHTTTNILESKVGLVLLLEPVKGTFLIVASYGINVKTVEQLSEIIKGISYSKQTSKQALNKMRDEVRTVIKTLDPSLERSVGVPIFEENNIFGVIFNFIDYDYIISPERIRFLEGFGGWVAIAVRNSKIYDRVKSEKQRLNAIIQQSGQGIMILDATLKITEFNAALAKMTGIASDQAIGASHSDFFYNIILRTKTDLHGAISNGWPLPYNNQPLYVEGTLTAYDGRSVTLGIIYSPLINIKGEITGIIANVRDVAFSERENAEPELFIGIDQQEPLKYSPDIRTGLVSVEFIDNESEQFHSVFISHASKDEVFVKRLYNDLQGTGVRCWYAPEDLKAGQKLYEQIDSAIKIYDKLLLVISEASMASQWVDTELWKTLQYEQEHRKRKLFPISIVPFEGIQRWEAFNADTGKDMARELREYYIPTDFSNWKDHDSYQKAFDKLVQDLRADETPTA